MKTKTITIYEFDELSEDAKEHAISNYRNNSTEYAWGDDWIESLKAFCKITGITLKDWSIGPYSHSYIKWDYSLEHIELDDIKGFRLISWLQNNWIYYLEKPKYIWSNKKHYYSKCQKSIDCPLTGYCGDMSLIQPILDFIKNPDKNTSLQDIIENCFSQFIKEFNSDMEYQDSDEYIIETIEANDYEFDENGNIA